MAPHPFDSSIDRWATLVVLVTILVFVWKKVSPHLPFRVPPRLVLGVLALLAVVALVKAISEKSPVTLALCVLLLGLLLFLGWCWIVTAKGREARKQQLEQARGRERRRAQPPLPRGPQGGTT